MKYIDIMEERKMESLVKLQTMARTTPLDQNQAQIYMETEKVRSFDQLWLEHQVTEEEISRGFREHNLQTDPQFQNLVQ